MIAFNSNHPFAWPGWLPNWTTDLEIAERNRYIRECRLRLMAVLGAFVLNGQLVYWRVVRRFRMAILYLANGPMVFLAGFMPEARGLHWDRKRI